MEELPMGWAPASIEEVGLPTTPKIEPFRFPKEVFELYSVPSFSNGEPELVAGEEIKSSKQFVQEGDVLLCKIVPHLNRVWVVPTANHHRQIASTEWIVVRSKELDSNYLRYCLMGPIFRELFMGEVSGVGGSLMRARPQGVAKIRIPIAPSAEQRRIVEKLDNILARSRRSREELEHIPRLVDRYKGAVLEAAFSGKLTANWRTHIGQSAAWSRKKLGNVVESIRYGTSKKCDRNASLTPVLRIPNIGNGIILQDDLKFAAFDVREREKLRLVRGDILFIRSNGSLDLVGKSALVSEKEEGFLYAGYLIRIRPLHEEITPKFLLYYLMSPSTRSTIEMLAKSTSGVNNINSQEIASIELPIPSSKEQVEITRIIEKRFTTIENSCNEALRAEKLLNRLNERTLAKAFRGELVHQSASDEPASMLLNRLQRAKIEKAPSRKR
jgi:type I restriction enzyme, S subunit